METIKTNIKELFTRLHAPFDITEESLEYSYVIFNDKYLVEEVSTGFNIYEVFDFDEGFIEAVHSEQNVLPVLAALYVKEITKIASEIVERNL